MMSTNAIALGKPETGIGEAGSPKRKLARTAGILYLIIIVAGIFAEFFVRQSLKVPGDAAATASNIMAAEGLFRLQIAADMIMIVADIALALVFYELFKTVSRGLALLAAFFRLTQAIILGMNLLNLFFTLQLLSGVDYLTVLGAEQRYALSMLFLESHSIGYSIGLLFFGINLLILGFLVFKSGYFPRFLGVLLVAAAFGYVLDTLAKVLLPNYVEYEAIFTGIVFIPAFIAELVLALWLLIKGVSDNPPEGSVSNTKRQAERLTA